jgi:hypothetical protein
MPKEPEILEYHRPQPHPDSWQWRLIRRWLTAGCFGGAVYLGVFSYIEPKIAGPFFRSPITYMSVGLAQAGIAIVALTLRLDREQSRKNR